MNKKVTVKECLGSKIAEVVTVSGHIQAIRRLGAITFIVLRDGTGSIQLVAEENIKIEAPMPQTLDDLQLEQAITVRGSLVEAPGEASRFELRVEDIAVLSCPNGPLPVEIGKQKRMQSLQLPVLLNNRPLTLRNERIRAIFKIQAAICHAFREFLREEQFTEIHSPKIVSTGTEGGANLFTVDYFGNTAYLAQSPQFYKQIMVGVFQKVFEIGPVYRAESHNTIRHLNEYVSMDIEAGFIECKSRTKQNNETGAKRITIPMLRE